MPKKKKSQNTKLSDVLILLGAIIALIIGVLDILGIGSLGLGIWSINSFIPGVGLIIAIVLILFALITLATTEVIKFPWKFTKNWSMILILGIILLLLGGGIGGLLVIIGAIIMYL
jgi:hypothetical protein